MHQTILAQRKAAAIHKLAQASQAIGRHLELNPALVEAFHPAGIRDPQVKEMMIWEAASNMIVRLGILSGALQEGVTAVNEAEPLSSAPEADTRPTAGAEEDPGEDELLFNLDPEPTTPDETAIEEKNAESSFAEAETEAPEPEDPPAKKSTKRKKKK